MDIYDRESRRISFFGKCYDILGMSIVVQDLCGKGEDRIQERDFFFIFGVQGFLGFMGLGSIRRAFVMDWMCFL